MRFGSVGASSPSRLSESLLVFVALHYGSYGFRHRTAASGLVQRSSFRYPSVIGLLPRAFALRFVALRFGQEDGQPGFLDDRATS